MSTKENGSNATNEIRGDIERARADMARTVGQIEERLTPAQLKGHVANLSDAVVSQYHETKDHLKADLRSELSEAKQSVKQELREAKAVVAGELREAKAAVAGEIQNVKTVAYDATVGKVQNMAHDASETVRDAGTTFLDSVKRNPIPAVAVALGIGWLLMDARRPGRRLSNGVEDGGWRVREKVGDLAQRAGDQIGHLASDVRDGALEAAHDARDATVHAADGAREMAHQVAVGTKHVAEDARDMGRNAIRSAGRGYHRAEEGFGHALEVNPLAVGAVAVALGAVIGLALPHTNKEDEWMGETKDRLLSRAKGIAQGAATDAMHEVQEAAQGAIQQAETKLGEKVEMFGAQTHAGRSNGRLEAAGSRDPAQPT